jgi:hypothetical protein
MKKHDQIMMDLYIFSTLQYRKAVLEYKLSMCTSYEP